MTAAFYISQKSSVKLSVRSKSFTDDFKRKRNMDESITFNRNNVSINEEDDSESMVIKVSNTRPAAQFS